MKIRKLNNKSISIVVVAYNMKREIQRTLYSLSRTYQMEAEKADYEVIVVDNGSDKNMVYKDVSHYGNNFFYHYIEKAPPSPAYAVNFGVMKSVKSIVGIMIDGARILTPGVLSYVGKAFDLFPNPIVCLLSWHIGPELQRIAIQKGYNREKEDELLESIDWQNNGYKLFSISSLSASSKDGWFHPLPESNCLFMKKSIFKKLKGFDERFNLPGGGIVNHDFCKRAVTEPNTQLVYILGEGNFHQVHQGVTTNTNSNFNEIWKKYADQYKCIRGVEYSVPERYPDAHIGHIPVEAVPFLNAVKTSP